MGWRTFIIGIVILGLGAVGFVGATNGWFGRAAGVQPKHQRTQNQTIQANTLSPPPIQSHVVPAREQQSAPVPSKCYGHSPDGALRVYAPIDGRCPEGG
jgi:hypothetical protein